MPTYATPGSSLLLSAALGLGVAVLYAGLFALIPAWNFYLTLMLGFGVAEAMAWAAKNKRGVDLQVAGIAVVLIALALGRVVLATRLNISWEQVNAFTPRVEDQLRLSLTPDGLFAAIAVLIPWYRFR